MGKSGLFPFSLLFVLKGFVGNLGIFSVGTCMVFFQDGQYLQRLIPMD